MNGDSRWLDDDVFKRHPWSSHGGAGGRFPALFAAASMQHPCAAAAMRCAAVRRAGVVVCRASQTDSCRLHARGASTRLGVLPSPFSFPQSSRGGSQSQALLLHEAR